MKKHLVITAYALVLAASASAQGLINFMNTPTTLVTLLDWGGPLGPIPAGMPGQFSFQLFVAPQGTVSDGFQFTSMSIFGSNLPTAGRFNGGTMPAVGVPPGSTRAILVRGWSSNLGADYDTAYFNFWFLGLPGYIGSSAIAPNFVFGGFDGINNFPTSAAFGGANGIQSGFELTVAPEPSAIALAGLGFASLILSRRHNRKT